LHRQVLFLAVLLVRFSYEKPRIVAENAHLGRKTLETRKINLAGAFGRYAFPEIRL
jgi:hypothetical protein